MVTFGLLGTLGGGLLAALAPAPFETRAHLRLMGTWGHPVESPMRAVIRLRALIDHYADGEAFDVEAETGFGPLWYRRPQIDLRVRSETSEGLQEAVGLALRDLIRPHSAWASSQRTAEQEMISRLERYLHDAWASGEELPKSVEERLQDVLRSSYEVVHSRDSAVVQGPTPAAAPSHRLTTLVLGGLMLGLFAGLIFGLLRASEGGRRYMDYPGRLVIAQLVRGRWVFIALIIAGAAAGAVLERSHQADHHLSTILGPAMHSNEIAATAPRETYTMAALLASDQETPVEVFVLEDASRIHRPLHMVELIARGNVPEDNHAALASITRDLKDRFQQDFYLMHPEYQAAMLRARTPFEDLSPYAVSGMALDLRALRRAQNEARPPAVFRKIGPYRSRRWPGLRILLGATLGGVLFLVWISLGTALAARRRLSP